MQVFKIRELSEEDYKFVIISTSYQTPFSQLDEISHELLKTNPGSYKVVFDLLLNMGNASDRFVEAFFDGRELRKNSFKPVKLSKKNSLRKISTEFFSSNQNILNNSVLTSMQKQMLGKGMVI